MMDSSQNDSQHAGTIWAVHLHGDRPYFEPLVPARFDRLGPDSVGVLAAAMGPGSVAEVIRRFRSGDQCYGAWVGSELAAYGWVSFEQEYVGEFKVWVRLVPGEAYIWDCFTLPAHRQRGLYSGLLVYMLGQLEKDNECRVWIGADMDNLASQRGIARAGFGAVADIVLARVVAMRLPWVQGRPGVPDSMVAEARRVFLDNRDTVWLRAVQPLKGAAQPRTEEIIKSSWPGQLPLPDSPPSSDDPAASRTALP
jgi:hypothetical protein